MKDIRNKIIGLLKEGHCTPQISRIAKRLKDPATTIQYNIKKMEKEKEILAYKAVFNYKSIGEGYCTFVLINLSPDEYGDPERISGELVKHPEIESIDIITGDWELLVKVRTKDQDAHYQFIKNVLARKGITKITSLTSLKNLKSEFVATE